MDKEKAAFPCGYHPDGNVYDQSGMTLRDWFAGMALSGLLADERIKIGTPPKQFASDAYVMADSMLAEREKCQ